MSEETKLKGLEWFADKACVSKQTARKMLREAPELYGAVKVGTRSERAQWRVDPEKVAIALSTSPSK